MFFLIWAVVLPFAYFFGHHSAEWNRNFSYWLETEFFPRGANLWMATGYTWIILSMIAIGVGLATCLTRKDEYSDWEMTSRGGWRKAVLGVCALLLVLGWAPVIGRFWTNAVDNAKSEGQFYNAATVWAQDPNRASSALTLLLEGAKDDPGGRCDKLGKHDVPSCIKFGSYSTDWEERISPAVGAMRFMKNRTGLTQNTYLIEGSLTYLYGSTAGTGMWTAIRDGQTGQSVSGVVEYRGGREATECAFDKGEYWIKGSFAGDYSMNLTNQIAARYPSLRWDETDMWGYCEGSKPVIVIATYRQTGFDQRAVIEPGGVLDIRGSADGAPVIVHKPTVRAGEYAGPVYPIAIVSKQRTNNVWAAGERYNNRLGFGFTVTPDASQIGNNSEYLLRSAQDHRLYWVTPMVLNNAGGSTLIMTYMVTPADQVTAGKLEVSTFYVLGDNDPRISNLGLYENDIINYLLNNGILPKTIGLDIVEFTPTKQGWWRAFGQIEGKNGVLVPRYRFDIKTDTTRVQELQVVVIDDNGQEQPLGACGDDIASMDNDTFVGCYSAFSDEMIKRVNGATPTTDATPSPTPSPTPTR